MLALRLTEEAVEDGFLRFLAAIGSSLLVLAIENPGQTTDVSVVMRCCPNLHKLNLKRGAVEMQLHFCQYRARNLPLPTMPQFWGNVETLAATLRDLDNPLTKYVRRLKIDLTARDESRRILYSGQQVIRFLDALLLLVDTNEFIQYFEVKVPSEHRNYRERFWSCNNTLINLGLGTEINVAFLSVVLDQRPFLEASSYKRKEHFKLGYRCSRWNLDQHILSRSFAYAASLAPRQVFCFWQT